MVVKPLSLSTNTVEFVWVMRQRVVGPYRWIDGSHPWLVYGKLIQMLLKVLQGGVVWCVRYRDSCFRSEGDRGPEGAKIEEARAMHFGMKLHGKMATEVRRLRVIAYLLFIKLKKNEKLIKVLGLYNYYDDILKLASCFDFCIFFLTLDVKIML